MADTKFTALPAAGSIALTDIIPCVILSGPTTSKIPVSVLRTAILPIILSGAEVSGTLPASKGGTGLGALGSGVATWLGTPSGANFASALTGTLPVTLLAPSVTNTFVLTTTGGVVVWAAASGGGASAGGAGQVQTSDGAGAFTAPSTVLAGSGFISIGATPASAGESRYLNVASMRVRNAANSGDNAVWASDASNQLFLGCRFAAGFQDSFQYIYVNALTAQYFSLSGSTVLQLDTVAVSIAEPLIGLSGPWSGMNGFFTKAMSGSTYSLAASEYCNSSILITGTGTNVIKFPTVTDPQGVFKFVMNAGSGTLDIQDSSGHASANGTLPAGKGAIVEFRNGAVRWWGGALTVA